MRLAVEYTIHRSITSQFEDVVAVGTTEAGLVKHLLICSKPLFVSLCSTGQYLSVGYTVFEHARQISFVVAFIGDDGDGGVSYAEPSKEVGQLPWRRQAVSG